MNKSQEKMVEILKNNRVLEALKREFDRSFAIKISETDNKVKIEFEEKDTGLPVMTVGDVAAFLQTDRASVRRMTESLRNAWRRIPRNVGKIPLIYQAN